MSIINKISLKYLKNNKRKVIVIILNIILSTMLLFTVALGASTLRGHSVKDSINYVGDHHVIYKNLSYNLYENLINDKKIKDVIVMQEESITHEDNSFKLVSLDKNIDEYIILDLGRYPENNNEIIASNKSNYKINDTIGSYKIVGLYKEVKRTLELDELSLITKDNLKKNLDANYLVTFKNSIRLYNEIYRKADEIGLTYTLDHTGARVYEQAEEIIRLSKTLQEPLIVIEEVNTYDSVTYKSLGYTLNRNYYCKSDDLCIVNEVEFLLFDKYFIWGWIS